MQNDFYVNTVSSDYYACRHFAVSYLCSFVALVKRTAYLHIGSGKIRKQIVSEKRHYHKRDLQTGNLSWLYM